MGPDVTDVAIVGAGPYGLSAAAHLRRAGVSTRVFGEPMSFWRTMPRGLLLRSNWSASNIAERDGELSLASYQAETGERFGAPVPLERFVAYGDWVQRRAVPDLERRFVTAIAAARPGFRLELDDGESVRARRVVVACGIAPFAWRPSELSHVPRELVSHTADHADPARFAGRRVAVVGGGQSALESAALLCEAGAAVEVFVRARRIVWLRGVSVYKRLGPVAPIVYAPTDVGPLWYSRLVAVPDLFRRLPRSAQTPIAARCIRPAGSHWLRERLIDVPVHVGAAISGARARGGGLELTADDGTTMSADHLLLGTGYRVDIARYPFLPNALVSAIRRTGGYPLLSAGLESSVPGLHFLGAPAAWSFGPIMRFVSGTWYAARALTGKVTGRHAVAVDLATAVVGRRPSGQAARSYAR